MSRSKHTTSARATYVGPPETYFHPDDPAGWLKPGEPFMVDGLDWSWTFVWYKEVPDFPGYCAGTNGTVWSKLVNVGQKSRPVGSSWTWLKPMKCGRYRQINLYRDGRRYRNSVHRIVLETFVGPCPPGMLGLHRNDDSLNSRLSNIVWGTPKDNYADAVRNGGAHQGEKNGLAKLTESAVLEIRETYAAGGVTLAQLATKHRTQLSNISGIVRGKSWKHVGGPITRRGLGSNRTPDKVATGIREAIAGGMTIAKAAERFGVYPVTVDSIIHRRHAWRESIKR
jgi:hypothetical protein